MLTWDEIVLDGGAYLETGDIYNQAPVSRFDSRFKVSLSRRRYDCLLHHSRWENSTTVIISTILTSFKEQNLPIYNEISIQNGVKLGACSCSKHGHRNQMSEPNLPEDVIMQETVEMQTFFHNIFNGTKLGPGLGAIQRPLLDIIQECTYKPDLQCYLFLKWVRNLISIALHYDISLLEPSPEREEGDDDTSDSDSALNSSGASVPES